MNILIFISQILLILGFTYGALRLGRQALVTLVTLLAILANFFVLKQIPLLGFHVTCSDALVIGSVLGLNLLREHFGKEAAKETTKICFFFMVFFTLLSNLHLRFVPSPFDTAHFAYAKLLTPTPRLLIASISTFWIVQQIDIRLFGWISHLLPKSPFPYRSGISLTLSQLLDTLLFTFLGLYGMVDRLGDIILVSFAIKVATILLMNPLTGFFNRVGRRV